MLCTCQYGCLCHVPRKFYLTRSRAGASKPHKAARSCTKLRIQRRRWAFSYSTAVWNGVCREDRASALSSGRSLYFTLGSGVALFPKFSEYHFKIVRDRTLFLRRLFRQATFEVGRNAKVQGLSLCHGFGVNPVTTCEC